MAGKPAGEVKPVPGKGTKGRGEITHSAPNDRRSKVAGIYFEESDNKIGPKIITFQDHGLGRAYKDKVINKWQRQAGENFWEHWYHAGLAGHIPAMGMEVSPAVDSFGGMPDSEFAMNHRLEYRRSVQAMGMINSRIVEWVVCNQQKLEVIELGWPKAKKRLVEGLEKLVKLYGLY